MFHNVSFNQKIKSMWSIFPCYFSSPHQWYHKYARVGVKLPLRESYFDHNKNLWVPQACAYATLRQSLANLMFHNVSFNFATAISKFDTFSSYHIVRTQIAKGKNFLPFCTIGISMYQNVFYPILLFPLLSHPKLLPLWSVTDGQTDGQHSSGCDFFRKYTGTQIRIGRCWTYFPSHSKELEG